MELTADAIKALVSRPTTRHRVTSVFINTDGARFPRAADYEARLDALLKDAETAVIDLHGAARDGVEADTRAIRDYVTNTFDRSGGVKGLGIFSSNGEVIDTIQTAEPFRNISRVADHPYVVPLQAMLGRHHHIGLAVIERDKARVFRYRLGRIVEFSRIDSEVPGHSSGGGWAQNRFQRNAENAVLHHFKDAADALRHAHEDEPFDALVLAGANPEVEGFRKVLHPYLQKVIHGEQASVSSVATHDEVITVLSKVEQHLVSARRQELLDRLAAGDGQGERVARGLRHVLEACNERRIQTLFVVEGTGQRGYRSATGMLTLHEIDAAAFGGPVEPVDDLIDEIIERCVMAGARIELFRDAERLDGHSVAALLRF